MLEELAQLLQNTEELESNLGNVIHNLQLCSLKKKSKEIEG